MKELNINSMETIVTCQICGFEASSLIGHLYYKHNTKCKDYKISFPGYKLIADSISIPNHLHRTDTMHRKGLFTSAAAKTSIKRHLTNNYPQKYKGKTKEQCPELAEKGKKISHSLKEGYFSGRLTQPNKGKTKETHPEVARWAKNVSKSRIEKISNGLIDLHKLRGGSGKGGFRKDLNHYVRSKLEANFCRILRDNKVEYIYEPQVFLLSDGTSYLPDFKLPRQNIFIELKGRPYEEGQRKINLFQKEYSQHKLIVLYQSSYKWKVLRNMYKEKLLNWET